MPCTPPRAPSIRFAVEPGDVPTEKIARRLHLTLAQFEAIKVRLFVRGFPRPDETTGMYDLEAVDRWRHRRHPSLFPELFTHDVSELHAISEKSMGQLARESFERRQDERSRDLGAAAREGHERRQAERRRKSN